MLRADTAADPTHPLIHKRLQRFLYALHTAFTAAQVLISHFPPLHARERRSYAHTQRSLSWQLQPCSAATMLRRRTACRTHGRSYPSPCRLLQPRSAGAVNVRAAKTHRQWGHLLGPSAAIRHVQVQIAVPVVPVASHHDLLTDPSKAVFHLLHQLKHPLRRHRHVVLVHSPCTPRDRQR